jgi:glycosyltransferase involved in cell wall biosynthesis
MKYSVCIISYKNDDTIRASLESLFPQIDDRFEVVLADNGGGRARDEYLVSLECEGRFRRVRTFGASRGAGRQIAHQFARGDYELSCFDTDDVLRPNSIEPLLSLYHKRAEGMFFVSRQLSIAPRPLIDELGGYADINRGEDNHLWCRAFLKGKYVDFLHYDVIERRPAESRSLLHRLSSRYGWARDKFRTGVNPIHFYGMERSLLPTFPIFALAWLDARRRPRLPDCQMLTTKDYATYFGARERGMLALPEVESAR